MKKCQIGVISKAMKKMNVGETDLVVRFILGMTLLIFGITGGLEAPVNFDPSQHHWLIIGLEPIMGTLSTPLSITAIVTSLVVLYTAATRFCLLYPIFRINTYHAE